MRSTRTRPARRRGLERDLAVGHYKPINSDRFVNDCHEFVFQFTPEGRTPLDRRAIGVAYQDESNIARWRTGGSNRRCRGNTWFIPYETIQSRDKDRPHPATFPPRLAAYCLRLHGLSRLRLVMDPFLGLGSAAVACAELGVNFVGVEIDEHYLGEAIERRAQARLRAFARLNADSNAEVNRIHFSIRFETLSIRDQKSKRRPSCTCRGAPGLFVRISCPNVAEVGSDPSGRGSWDWSGRQTRNRQARCRRSSWSRPFQRAGCSPS